jgi:outer membrane protein TolC
MINLLIAVLLLGASPSAAQDNQTTVDSLVQLALQRNPSLTAAQYRFEADQYRAAAAGGLPNPQLSIGLLNLPASSLALDETPMSGVQVGLMQKIPWPGKLSAQSRIAGLASESSAFSLAANRNAIARAVRTTYAEYSYQSLTLEVLARNRTLIAQIKTVAETRYANGEGSAQDVLRVGTALARLDNRVLMAEQIRASALAELGRLVDDPEYSAWELADGLTEPGNNPTTLGSTSSVEANPVLVRAGTMSNLAAEKVKLARSDYWPNFAFGIDYRFREDHPMDAVHGEDFLTFKVGLELPLWFFKKQKNQRAAAEHSLLAAEANEKSIRDMLSRRLTDVDLALNSLGKRIAQYDSSIQPQAGAALEAARIAYEVGQVDFNGLLAAQMDLLNIEMERLELVKQYNQQSAHRIELVSTVESRL